MKDHRYLAYGPEYGAGKMGKPALIGHELTDFRGDKAVLYSIEVPRTLNSTGRVYVKPVGAPPEEMTRGFYPSVFGLEWAGSIELDGNQELTRG